VTGIMGVVFFVYNAVFALILLVLVLLASVYAIAAKNPDMRYQPMRDDRGSFIKSQTQLNTELDALGATARGDMKSSPYKFDDDAGSFSSGNGASVSRLPLDEASVGTATVRRGPTSPVDPSVPLFPSDHGGRRIASPPSYEGYNDGPAPEYYGQPQNGASSAPRGDYDYDNTPFRSGSVSNPQSYRTQNNASPWRRGAGYEH
jgi:Transient receptor potential (TRP) ion channel